jgi:AcrR family transcriptional regulator
VHGASASEGSEPRDRPTAEPTAGRVRKKAARRAALQSAALDLFGRKGYTATTVEEIAAACGVSHVTFFNYFPKKDDVLFARGQERRQQIVTALAARPVEELPFVALRAAFLAVVPDYEADRDRLLVVRTILERTPSLLTHVWERRQGWEEAIVDVLVAREQGVPHPFSRLELGVLAGAAILAMRSAQSVWIDDDSLPLQQRVAAAFDHIEQGFGADRLLQRTASNGSSR